MKALQRDVVRTVREWPIFAFYVAATLVVATIIGLITVNIIDLGMQHFGEASHRTHDVAYGALFTTLVLGVVVQLRRPEHNIAAMVMALVPGAALFLAALLVDDLDRVFEFNPLRYAAAVAAVTALLHPSGQAALRSFRFTAISWPMLALTGIAAVPLLGLASTNVQLQRNVTDMHVFMGHYGFMAALAYTIIGVAILASLRPVGWRLTAAVAALLAAVLGGTSLLYPDAASSLDTGWALAAIAWATAFAGLAVRTDDAQRPTSMPVAPLDPDPWPVPGDHADSDVVSFEPGRRHPSRRRLIALAAGSLLLVAAGGWVTADSDRAFERQQLVAERGANVMPFDLDATTHIFEPTATGGVQTVVADDPSDTEQVGRVRDHLRRERDQFSVGEFGDPATIHGDAMPGLAVLEARFDALDMVYRDVAAGGEITFRSSAPEVVEALHDWFDAQLSDHGSHAEGR